MRLRGFQPILCAALLAGTAGCAGDGKKDSDGYVMVCEDTALTGSEINRVRCRRKVDVEERRRRDRAFMQHMQNETPRPRIGGQPGQ